MKVCQLSRHKQLTRWGLAALLSLALTPSLGQAAGKISKTVDAEGNVVYSDVAPSPQDTEVGLESEELNTFENPPPADPSDELPVVVLENDEDAQDVELPPDYTSLKITSPSNDEGVRANDGNIVLQAAVEPGLFKSHQLRFYLDGSPAGTSRGAQLPLSNVDRGTHQAKVAIVDAGGNVLRESEMVVFHVLRYFKRPPQPRGSR